ncbi:hypothetical protein H0H92_015926 [Tricholoma furcatifolium]|nr:hypothetical protein H0H92_015926 [Tricholoma furcatifolium]
MDHASDEGVRYYLKFRREMLLRRCIKWQDSFASLDQDLQGLLSDWGLSSEDLASARVIQTLEVVDEEHDVSDDESDDQNSVLIDTLDALELADAFRADNVEEYFLE